MNEHSRRTFLITTGATAAAGAAAVSAPAAAAASAPKGRQDRGTAAQAESAGAVVAYVSDASSGQVTVMRGEDEVVLTDHDLARRLSGEVR
jgi:hypothetical protein